MPHSALLVIHMRKGQLRMNLTMKMHCKIYWKRKTSLNKLKTLQTTEVEQSSDFEDPAEVDVTFWSKDGKKNIILKSMQAKDKAV